ncbi:unnamed protein product, partial [Adineta steineri]
DCIDILCNQHKVDGKHLINLNENEILSLTKNDQLWSKLKTLKRIKQQAVIVQLEPAIPNSSNYTSYDNIEDPLITNCCLLTSIRSDKKKTLSALFLVVISVYFCSFIITIVDERLPDPKTFPPLPDLILENIEQIPWAFAVTEKLIVIEITT